jgi:hypothetical protein
MGPIAAAGDGRGTRIYRKPSGPSGSSVVSCEVWGFGLMLVRSRDAAAAGGRGPQATHRGAIGARARPAAHHDRAGRRPSQRPAPCTHPVAGQPGEAGPGWTDAAIGAALEVNPATVARVRMRYVAAGLDGAVYRKPPARQYRRRLDGQPEARLVALTCSAPPQGDKRWRVRLLADRLVELQVVDSVSYETVRQVLQQTGSRRG